MAKINYELNNGQWAPKDEVKSAFYKELFDFANLKNDAEIKNILFADFVTFEPYVIGNMLGKYFLKENVGGNVKDQPQDFFIGYLYQNNKFLELIPHLEKFFAFWREIEGCMEENASDFYASSWASLVDTAKFFKYTTVEDLANSPEAPSVRDERILYMIQNCPGRYFAPVESSETEELRLPVPVRIGYEFAGWYTNPQFTGDKVSHISKALKESTTYYARWSTHTFFHSNDGYPYFEDLYTDFLNDYSKHLNKTVTKDKVRVDGHGWVTDFVKVSYDGKLNSFFAIKENHDKWIWLIDYFKALKKSAPAENKFVFENGKFNDEAQVRWELNSLFVSRYHLVWPKTGDYSGAGIKEKLTDSTNSQIVKVKYLVNDEVIFPEITRDGFTLVGYFDNPQGNGEVIKQINDERFAAKTIYAQWK
jgi:uncharacterized repeat protein (TIGR02543 family)